MKVLSAGGLVAKVRRAERGVREGLREGVVGKREGLRAKKEELKRMVGGVAKRVARRRDGSGHGKTQELAGAVTSDAAPEADVVEVEGDVAAANTSDAVPEAKAVEAAQDVTTFEALTTQTEGLHDADSVGIGSFKRRLETLSRKKQLLHSAVAFLEANDSSSSQTSTVEDESLKQRVELLEAENGTLQSSVVEQLEANAAAPAKQDATYREASDELKRKLTKTEARLAHSEEIIAALTKENTTVCSERDAALTDNHDLTDDKLKQQSELTASKTSISSLEQENRAIAETIAAICCERDTVTTRNDDLTSENRKLSKQNNKLSKQTVALRKHERLTVESLSAERDAFKGDAEDWENQFLELSDELESKIVALQAYLEDAAQDYVELQTEHAELEAKHSKLKTLHKKLFAEYEKVFTKHEQVKEQHKAATDKASAMEALAITKGKLADDAAKEKKELKAKSDGLKEDLEGCRESLRAQEEAMKQQLDSFAKEKTELLSRVATLEGQKDALQKDCNDHREVAEAADQDRVKLCSVRASNARLQNKVEAGEKAYNALQSKYNVLQAEHTTLQSDHRTLQTAHETARSDYDKKKKEQLEKDLESATTSEALETPIGECKTEAFTQDPWVCKTEAALANAMIVYRSFETQLIRWLETQQLTACVNAKYLRIDLRMAERYILTKERELVAGATEIAELCTTCRPDCQRDQAEVEAVRLYEKVDTLKATIHGLNGTVQELESKLLVSDDGATQAFYNGAYALHETRNLNAPAVKVCKSAEYADDQAARLLVACREGRVTNRQVKHVLEGVQKGLQDVNAMQWKVYEVQRYDFGGKLGRDMTAHWKSCQIDLAHVQRNLLEKRAALLNLLQSLSGGDDEDDSGDDDDGSGSPGRPNGHDTVGENQKDADGAEQSDSSRFADDERPPSGDSGYSSDESKHNVTQSDGIGRQQEAVVPLLTVEDPDGNVTIIDSAECLVREDETLHQWLAGVQNHAEQSAWDSANFLPTIEQSKATLEKGRALLEASKGSEVLPTVLERMLEETDLAKGKVKRLAAFISYGSSEWFVGIAADGMATKEEVEKEMETLERELSQLEMQLEAASKAVPSNGSMSEFLHASAFVSEERHGNNSSTALKKALQAPAFVPSGGEQVDDMAGEQEDAVETSKDDTTEDGDALDRPDSLDTEHKQPETSGPEPVQEHASEDDGTTETDGDVIIDQQTPTSAPPSDSSMGLSQKKTSRRNRKQTRKRAITLKSSATRELTVIEREIQEAKEKLASLQSASVATRTASQKTSSTQSTSSAPRSMREQTDSVAMTPSPRSSKEPRHRTGAITSQPKILPTSLKWKRKTSEDSAAASMQQQQQPVGTKTGNSDARDLNMSVHAPLPREVRGLQASMHAPPTNAPTNAPTGPRSPPEKHRSPNGQGKVDGRNKGKKPWKAHEQKNW